MSKAQYQLEKASEVFDEALPLMRAHYNEVAHFPEISFDPDINHYAYLDEYNLIRSYTARVDAGKLVGYASFFVKQHPHHKGSLQAFQDAVYIDPEYRGFGKDFIDWCDDQLRGEGFQAVYHFVKAKHDWGAILKRSGYECVEHLYARRL